MDEPPVRLLYVCHEPLPSPYTNTEQVVKTAAALTGAGLEVEVVVPRHRGTPPRAGHGRTVAEYYGVSATAFDQGLRIVEVPVPSAIRSSVTRPWHDIRAALHARRDTYDFVYTRDPFALLAALLVHKRVIFETYRPDLNARMIYGPWRAFCYTRSGLRGIITHSHLAQQTFLDAGIDARRVLVAHNGFAPETMVPRLTRDAARARLDLSPEGALVCYTGHIDGKKGLDVLADVARRLPDVRFLLVGRMEGSGVPKTLASLSNATVLPRVPPADVAPYLYAADCLIIPPSAGPLVTHGRTVLPLKTFQYLAAGRPILAPDLPDLREVLTARHDAVLVDPDAPEPAANALRTLLSDPVEQRRLSKNALATSARYTWEARATRIAAFLRDLLREPAVGSASAGPRRQ